MYKIVSLICFLFGLVGCGSAPIAKSVITANEAQEVAANQLLVLNIARAHEHMPMHFSLIGQIRSGPGSWSFGTPSLGLDIPFGGGSDSKYGLSIGAEGQTPVDVTPLSNQEFMRGMTQPVEAELLGFFIKQGWPPSMLMYIFFEAIEVVKDDAVIDRLQNDPLSGGFPRFQKFVEASMTCDLVVDRESSYRFFSTISEKITPLEGAEAKKADLVMVGVDKSGAPQKDERKNSHFRFASVSKDQVIRMTAKPNAKNKANAFCETGPIFDEEGRIAETKAEDFVEGSEKKSGVAGGGGKRKITSMYLGGQNRSSRNKEEDSVRKEDGSSNYEAQFILRSPQSMIYYLGEISRFQNAEWYSGGVSRPLKIPLPGGSKAALFQMSNREDFGLAAVSVNYNNKKFSVPFFNGDPAGDLQDRSVSTLSLLMLIVGLQDKGVSSPSVSNVRLLR